MARGPFPSDKQDQFMVRFPDGMRDRLKAAAEANNRSMNAEIVAQLEAHDEIDHLEKRAASLEAHVQASEERLMRLQIERSKSENELSQAMEKAQVKDQKSRAIIKKLIEAIDLPNGDIMRIGPQYDAIMYLAGVPTEQIQEATSAIRHERLIDLVPNDSAVPSSYKGHIKQMVATTLNPVLAYLRKAGWKLEPPEDWPTDK